MVGVRDSSLEGFLTCRLPRMMFAEGATKNYPSGCYLLYTIASKHRLTMATGALGYKRSLDQNSEPVGTIIR